MTAVASVDPALRRRRILRALVIGLLLLVPRIVLAWLVLPSQYDLLQVVATLVLVAGLFVIGAAIIRLRLPRSLLPVGLVGAGLVVLAGVVLRLLPPSGDAVVYTRGLVAPPDRALQIWFYLLDGALWQLGLVLLVGAVGAAIARRASR